MQISRHEVRQRRLQHKIETRHTLEYFLSPLHNFMHATQQRKKLTRVTLTIYEPFR